MFQPHSAVGLIHMLAAFAACSKSIDFALSQQFLIGGREGNAFHLRGSGFSFFRLHAVLYQMRRRFKKT